MLCIGGIREVFKDVFAINRTDTVIGKGQIFTEIQHDVRAVGEQVDIDPPRFRLASAPELHFGVGRQGHPPGASAASAMPTQQPGFMHELSQRPSKSERRLSFEPMC